MIGLVCMELRGGHGVNRAAAQAERGDNGVSATEMEVESGAAAVELEAGGLTRGHGRGHCCSGGHARRRQGT